MTDRAESGSAVIDAVLVVPMLMLVAASVLQVALALHVRSALTAAAGEAARAAALAGAAPSAASGRVQTLLVGTMAGAAVRSVRQEAGVEGGLPVVTVRIEATLPLLGLLGPTGLVVDGHALREGWS